jgi:NADPH:quinone reductase-like Zn-dependent oxidoreductase
VKAAWRDRYGGPEVVEIRDLPKPEPGPGDVLVRVIAASVNRADLDGLYPRWGFIKLFLGLRAPRAPFRSVGIDVAGVVESVGDGVTNFKPGDNVFSDLSSHGQGAFAEYVCAPAKAFALMPKGLTHEEAACLPHSGILALRAFDPRGGRTVEPGARVLIVGASGNVGPYAIQLARTLGAHITGVASADKLVFVRSLGVDEVIDYRATDYTRPARPYDWIVDVSAHHPLRRWLAALKPRGVYLSYAGPASWLIASAFMGPLLSLITGKKVGVALVTGFGEKDVPRLVDLAERGVFKPVIDRRFTLDEAADALRYVDDGRALGKVLVVP